MTDPANINAFIVGDVANAADFKACMTRLGLAVEITDAVVPEYFGGVEAFCAFQKMQSVFELQGKREHELKGLTVMQIRRHAWPVVRDNGSSSSEGPRTQYYERVLTALEKDVAKTLVQGRAPYQLVPGYHRATRDWVGHGATDGETASIGIVDRTAEPLETLYPWIPRTELQEWKKSEPALPAASCGGKRRRKAAARRFLNMTLGKKW